MDSCPIKALPMGASVKPLVTQSGLPENFSTRHRQLCSWLNKVIKLENKKDVISDVF
jgi:hypothetical protein